MSGCQVTEPQRRRVLPFQAEPAEVRLLRKAAAAQLVQWGMSTAVEEAELFVTELATNVIKHVGEGATAALVLESHSGRLRVEVHDESLVVPSLVTAGCDEECGRGLHLLSTLAADWGTVMTAAGKAVWCEISFQREHRRRFERAADFLGSNRGARDGAVLQDTERSGGLDESAVELIADLLHWTAARGRAPEGMLDRAQAHFDAGSDAA
ncbi:ATP-binding protein [Streptomyces sp. NPDC127072]|uniref:ATP-binding protein n=1 Tax=Streptomyces sp. NPDC127072 TaxID=3347129 RepID=UPI00365CB715